ncbi:Short-chain dehydrogenase reductase SDR [Fusarium albosuccineum]|uniref:Short-chain dehydrogenase reductase SDR n=1 Tax=Fusarium albosuccineum TaxID=1237068 RepID=A0A8H4LHM8_9HYPO|nr:Short-chain dehydrogenase reductase SDR [Fusarium albosuccineum]
MPFILPKVSPLPAGIDLSSKTAIVTGATSGIGLEITRQLLTLKVSTLILAVRNVSKGEEVRKTLLSEPAIKTANPNANVQVMKLDTEDYASVQSFVDGFKSKYDKLHLLMLNAGIGTLAREFAPNGHEKNIQVNYLSNVLLTVSLLPLLEATAGKEGSPTRMTWTGSRTHKRTSLAGNVPLKQGEGVLQHFDTAEDIPAFARYGDSKLLGVLFQLELANHIDPSKVIVNSFCPAMVATAMSDVLPVYLRIPMDLIKAIRARSPEKAAWIGLNAALVAGKESHGRLLEDNKVADLGEFVESEEGAKVRRLLWEETVEEMRGLVALPSWMEINAYLGAERHHRLLQYKLGDLNCVIRSQADVLYATTAEDRHEFEAEPGPASEKKSMKDLDHLLHLLEYGTPAEDAVPGSDMRLTSYSTKVPQSRLAEVKTSLRGRQFKPASLLPWLWLGRTPCLIHALGTGKEIEQIDQYILEGELKRWEDDESNQQALRKMVSLLRQLRDLVAKSKTGACMAIPSKTGKNRDLDVFEMPEAKSPLPRATIEEFWS